MLTVMPQGMGSYPKDMDVCKCIVFLRHRGTLNSCRAVSPLVWLVEGEETWEALDHPRVFSLKIGMEPRKIVLLPAWCSKFRLTSGVKIQPLAAINYVSLDLMLLSISCQVIYSQFGLAIHQNDHQARRRFVEWAQNEIAVVPDFHKRILFSDEAHFWLNGYVNKQNCRIWSEANPQVYVETPLHPEKLTVWCALWAGGIIGPYFFKNDEGHIVKLYKF
ncbi:hypothetical protein TNCV_70091 [Trichonephila clavipes]|nr:hypothetical protein TNCV_70091 [Trichonephila clavipes]